MIFEHEIPEGSKLYFGGAARTKREIERIASEVLFSGGYEEIVTPLFSYHQHQSISDQRELVRVNDNANHRMSLRADSTIDVVRIIDKRLGRNTSHKKWFYIQPVYRFPSCEQYQVGAEHIGEKNLSGVLNDVFDVFDKLEVTPTLQVSNIRIPQKIAEMLDIDLADFRTINVEKFLSKNIEWLTKLVYIHTPEDIDGAMAVAPEPIKEELQKLKELCAEVTYKKVVIAPLYYAKMLYYDELFFRVIEKNDVFARGGRYKNDELTSVGFAIYTDALIEKLSKD
ncbi:MAG TPA: ATP phosphoribosyltransferase regulatory subunit [Helicobacteraceae bacterium]|nr:ATP phosphoribosyltransferase regulatory subunit [Helicobacteraceae bacterium]